MKLILNECLERNGYSSVEEALVAYTELDWTPSIPLFDPRTARWSRTAIVPTARPFITS